MEQEKTIDKECPVCKSKVVISYDCPSCRSRVCMVSRLDVLAQLSTPVQVCSEPEVVKGEIRIDSCGWRLSAVKNFLQNWAGRRLCFAKEA